MSSRLIFTGGGPAYLDNKYIVGGIIGALNPSVRRALKRRANNNASGNPCCSTPPSETSYTNLWEELYSGQETLIGDMYMLPNNPTIVEAASAYFNASGNTYYGDLTYNSGPSITLTQKANNSNTVTGYLFTNGGIIVFITGTQTPITWITSNLEIEVYITISGSTQPYTYKIQHSGSLSSPTSQQYEISFPY